MNDFDTIDFKKLQVMVELAQKVYVTPKEAMILYSLGAHSIDKISKDARARRRIGNKVLINVQVFNAYIEKELCEAEE